MSEADGEAPMRRKGRPGEGQKSGCVVVAAIHPTPPPFLIVSPKQITLYQQPLASHLRRVASAAQPPFPTSSGRWSQPATLCIGATRGPVWRRAFSPPPPSLGGGASQPGSADARPGVGSPLVYSHMPSCYRHHSVGTAVTATARAMTPPATECHFITSAGGRQI